MSRDPLAALYEDLERGGYDPRGPEHDFRSRCPGHGGEAHSLHVCEGVDRRAVLYCFAHQCEPVAIMAALGRGVRDLFPDDDGTPYQPGTGRRKSNRDSADATSTVLVGLTSADIDWQPARLRDGTINPDFFVAARCPACSSANLWVHRRSPHDVSLSCWGNCSERVIRGALRIEAVTP